MNLLTDTRKTCEERIREYTQILEQGIETEQSDEWRRDEIKRYKRLLQENKRKVNELHEESKKPLVSDEERVECVILITKRDRLLQKTNLLKFFS